GGIHIRPGMDSNGSFTVKSKDMEWISYGCWYAMKLGQKHVPIYIFPFEMTSQNLSIFEPQFPQHKAFWAQLKTAYDKFLDSHQPLEFSVDDKGNYVFK